MSSLFGSIENPNNKFPEINEVLRRCKTGLRNILIHETVPKRSRPVIFRRRDGQDVAVKVTGTMEDEMDLMVRLLIVGIPGVRENSDKPIKVRTLPPIDLI